MKADSRKLGAADRRLLPEGRLSGPMPWVIAIMMFLTVLAAAAALALGGAASRLDADIGNRVTIQIMEPIPAVREAEADRAVRTLRAFPGVEEVRRLDDQEMMRLLEPWLGTAGVDAGLPIPVMIDADLTPDAYRGLADLRAAVTAVAASARVDDNGEWLAPLAKLIDGLRLLAAGLVLLMIGATAATVVLAARASLDTHRGTIEVLHLMGSTDLQVARLFQRRIALDALFGGLVGLVAAAAVLLLIGQQIAALGSDLLGSAGLSLENWLILAALPVGGVLLAMLVARLTILRALGRLL